MWIRSQNRRELVNIYRVEISAIVPEGSNNVIIFGYYENKKLFSSNRVQLGTYKSMEEALNEIDAIEKGIVSNPNGVYDMR